ncbi:MAG: hypothetical protein GW911_21975 [Armatimonadetes bacterium]|nr:hypothetical protein [Armatimonadota bacterium]
MAAGFYPDGHTALEQWADTVMAVNDLQPPKFRPCGYNSWYSYRLEISEDLLLQNARIMKERWAPLGLEYVQIDHGWQYKEVVGNWVPNERFPHGLPWLSGELGKLGYKLGLWLSVTNISEFAPFLSEHPEALMHNADGSPVVSAEYWFWEPHGKTYSLDPTHPVGARFYEDTGKALRDYGCRYAKNDFQTNIGSGTAVLHNNAMVHGVPVYRLGMDLLRKGMGPDVAYHSCNGMLNVIAGACDVAWTHRDMGNPRGDWESLSAWVNEFCCRYHVSGKFYWSDPDYLQVGQGTLNETQVRMAICALGGGPVTICDRLPELSEEKLALIPKCLPGHAKPARPLDLFTHLGYPQVWDLPVEAAWGKWHVVGVFNLADQPERIEVALSRLNLETGKPYVVWDFFGERLLGEVTPGGELELAVRVPAPAMSARLLRIAPKETRPFVLSTDMHLTQGGVELPEVKWEDDTLTLRGTARRAPGITGKVLIYVPPGFAPAAAGAAYSAPVLSVPLAFETEQQQWSVQFRRQ